MRARDLWPGPVVVGLIGLANLICLLTDGHWGVAFGAGVSLAAVLYETATNILRRETTQELVHSEAQIRELTANLSAIAAEKNNAYDYDSFIRQIAEGHIIAESEIYD